ncbi:ArnT family glycosyltransferase [Haloarcula onubensis]|uniref:Glycosyltransferase RgtA/B/C/D-like domain-containing protein n=1 Tax=Haloarcula onubensis TaxID=2950539 RepID=A0ABU2FJ76_9EURY|nr:hypothetical protein [Halomicroarcula sp. S3CR25-11]MDS0280782.1 hypothetical protein [Halomicroarcula sp. S3CR25-11]
MEIANNSLREKAQKLISSPWILLALFLISGLVGIGVATTYTNSYTLVVPPALIVGVVIFRFSSGDRVINTNSYIQTRLLLSVIIIGFGLVIFLFINSQYQRTSEVHILIAGLYGAAALLASMRPYIALYSGLSIGVLQRAMIYYSSATQFGLDTLFHQQMASRIAEVGSTQPLQMAESKYFATPFYHLLGSISVQIGGTTIRNAGFVIATIVAVIIPVAIIFTICQNCWNLRAGALAAILFLLSDYAIYFAMRPRPLSLSFGFFSILLIGLYRYITTRDIRHYCVFVAAMLGSVLTGHFVPFLLLLATILICGTYYIISPQKLRSVLLYPLIATVAVMSSWILTVYQSGNEGQTSFFQSIIQISIFKLQSTGNRNTVLPESEHYIVPGANALDPIQIAPTGILIAMAVAGLISIRFREDGNKSITLSLAGIFGIFSVFAFAGPLVGFSLLQPHRWFAFIYVPVTILAGVYLSSLNLDFFRDSQIISGIIILVLVSSTAMLAGGNYRGGQDGPIIDSPGAERLTVKDDEHAGMQFVAKHQGPHVLADFNTWQLLDRHYNAKSKVYRYSEYGGSSSHKTPYLAVYRPYSNTFKAKYRIDAEVGYWTVKGPIPKPNGHKIYANKGVRIIYVSQ